MQILMCVAFLVTQGKFYIANFDEILNILDPDLNSLLLKKNKDKIIIL